MHHISKLKNGITLVVAPVVGTKATTILAMFPVGSRYETDKLSGASHFVEHMMFKGTNKRPAAQDISRTIEAYGADYNAFTSKDYTGYYIRINGDDQEAAFDLLSDMIYHSKIEAVEVEKEKGPIVEELRMYKDNPLMAIDQLFEATIFGATPLGRDIGGTEKTVRGLSRAELWQYYQEHYSPRNMVLVVAGNIKTGRMESYLNYFIDQAAPKRAKIFNFYKHGFTKFVWPVSKLPLAKRVMVQEKKIDQAQVILGFPGIPNNHPDRFAASLMLNILGSGMSSRLFVEVRERRGLAYMVQAGSASYRDAGVVYAQAGLDPKRLKEALTVIQAEIMRMANEPVTEEELKNAKTSIAGSLALKLENSSFQAQWYAKEVIFNTTIETPEQAVNELNKVTIKDVQRIAKYLFVPHQTRLAVIGPTGTVSKNKIMKMLL
ncbi:MAG: insulinase family protein [Candidatus Magasanikbacteria bacterium]|nr:insulinase family protein [Candidatus Magasanikbacteria bacterium]